MTACEHCVKIVIAGERQAQCTPLSSVVVVHEGKKTLRYNGVQVCPTRGARSQGRIKGCAVANIADELQSSSMSKREWATSDVALQDAKLVEAQKGRKFRRIQRFRVYDSTKLFPFLRRP